MGCERPCLHKFLTTLVAAIPVIPRLLLASVAEQSYTKDRFFSWLGPDIEDLTRVVISYEIYETNLWQVS